MFGRAGRVGRAAARFWEAKIFLLGLLVLITLLLGLHQLGRLPPERAAALTRQGLAALAFGAAALALARGHFAVALALAGAALLTAAGGRFGAPFTFGGESRRGGLVELEFDGSGVRDGAVRAGRFAGSKLSEMSKTECESFYAQCRMEDPGALLALETYFDRRFPGWRAAADDDADAGRNGARRGGGEMSKEEAYQTLGLGWGASSDEIVRAHRALMKERHPDHGGTTDDAARLNQAKDRLLRRQG
jgi:hypothetical protein